MNYREFFKELMGECFDLDNEIRIKSDCGKECQIIRMYRDIDGLCLEITTDDVEGI